MTLSLDEWVSRKVPRKRQKATQSYCAALGLNRRFRLAGVLAHAPTLDQVDNTEQHDRADNRNPKAGE